MKKILLLMMCCPMILSAQNGVTVSNLDVKPGTVTFNVSWKKTGMPTLWSDSVWVFVDYNNGAGKMERLLLSGATLTAPSWPDATVVFGEDDNYQGAWVVGNARSAGNFSATVKLHTAIADLHGVCAYASNYPPVGEYTAANTISFTGTPMYNLVLRHQYNETDTIYRVSGAICDLPEDYILVSFTDATGAPGSFRDVRPTTPPYAVSMQTWTVSGTAGTQTWSDYINLPECNKPDYSPNTVTGDCRNNTTYPFLYSWFYVRNNARRLCPSPWRVPSSDELCLLDKIMNSSTACTNNRTGVMGAAYVRDWGLQYAGVCVTTPGYHDEEGDMWSLGEEDAHWKYGMQIKKTAVYPVRREQHSFGYAVRCLK